MRVDGDITNTTATEPEAPQFPETQKFARKIHNCNVLNGSKLLSWKEFHNFVKEFKSGTFDKNKHLSLFKNKLDSDDDRVITEDEFAHFFKDLFHWKRIHDKKPTITMNEFGLFTGYKGDRLVEEKFEKYFGCLHEPWERMR